MRSLRVVTNRVLWRWGLRDVLPGYYVRRIPVTECGEPLEPIPAVPGRLLLDPRFRREHLARHSVAGALRHAAELLPDDVQLLVVEAYRVWAAYGRRPTARFGPHTIRDSPGP